MITSKEDLKLKPGFSLRARCKSFIYAGRGIVDFFRTEPNARIHLFASVVALTMCIHFHVSRTEFIIVVFSIGFVWVGEMLNTAIEKTIDFITLEKHPQIRLIKDIAAGAVLVTSATALLAGLIIFLPKIFI